MKFFSFQTSSETFCRLAAMSEEEKVDYLKEVPNFMKALPHLFFMRNQAAMQRANALKNGANPGGMTWEKIYAVEAEARKKRNVIGPDGKQMDPRLAAEQQKLLQLLNSPDGQQKIATLTDVVEATKDEVMADVKDWDEARRKEYFEEFSKSEVVKSLKVIKSEDMLSRVQMFIDMPQSDLRQILMMNAVFNQDARSGGSLLKSMNSDKEQGGAVQNSMRHFSTIARMFGGERGPPGGGSQGGSGGPGPRPGDFPGGGPGASNGHQCNDPNCTIDHSKAKDVTSGSTESMDR